jgi:D-3-phosphoglycerate dehydrogenase
VIRQEVDSFSRTVNVLVNEPDIYSGIDFSKYDVIGKVFSSDQAGKDTGSIDAILVGLRDVIDDSFLQPFSRVKYIVSSTTGTDHIRASRDIKIIHLDPSEILEVSATAEFTLALLLSLVRKIPFIEDDNVGDRLAYRGTQLRGKKLGIFGMGRLGRKMARYAEALEMAWMGYDRDSQAEEKIEILKTCDVITLHLPLNKDTVDFIGQREFELMKKNPYLINTSRPHLINKAALFKALDNSLVAGVAMDFINYDASNEWDMDLKKYRGEKLLLTPHIGGNTHESVNFTAQVVVDKFISVIRNEWSD